MKTTSTKGLRIGFVAMSGIRVVDKELLEMGLTLPGFVERSKVIASLPSLGLLTLAGMTPDCHEVHYFEIDDLQSSPVTMEELSGFDLIAISTLSAQVGEGYRLADSLRELGVSVVMGGLHVSCCVDEAMDHVDSVIVGEGESCWPEVLQDGASGRLKPVYRSSKSFDLADAPMPAFELLDIDKYNRITVQTSRGCSHRCEFCAGSVLLTPQYKQKPMEKVLAEVDKICSIWQRPFIEFADDNSFVNKGYWKELLPELKKRKIRWFTESDISIADDPALLRLMHDAGCVQVLIGLESPSRSALGGLETRQNWKQNQAAHYRQSIETIQSHGISVNGCFILGLDDHGIEAFDEVYRFVEQAGLHEVQITILTPFPGTPFYQRLAREGRLLDDDGWEKCTLFDINYMPKQMTTGELSAGFKQLTTRLYSDFNTAKRRGRFREMVRQLARQKRKNYIVPDSRLEQESMHG
ncbi:MAG: radical SAM protein [Thermodesulfobacteriota bacterium]